MWIASVQHTTQFTSKTRIIGEPHECCRRLATSWAAARLLLPGIL